MLVLLSGYVATSPLSLLCKRWAMWQWPSLEGILRENELMHNKWKSVSSPFLFSELGWVLLLPGVVLGQAELSTLIK